MTAVSYDLCAPWATAADLTGPDCSEGCVDNAALMDDALAGASLILYNLTGSKWPGVCTDTIRPTAEHDQSAPPGWYPYESGNLGPWSSGYANPTVFPGMWGYCSCNRRVVCGAHAVSEIMLPGYPVDSITEVKIDGAVLSSAHYKIQDRRRLVYVPVAGEARTGWPCCQMVELPATEPNTWQVTYTWGAAPPSMGRRAAAVLACQLYLSMHPDRSGQCRLPQRITSITRQGVTIAVLDNFQVFKDGLTGLPMVDMWITSDRRANTQRRSEVITPAVLASMRRDAP